MNSPSPEVVFAVVHRLGIAMRKNPNETPFMSVEDIRQDLIGTALEDKFTTDEIQSVFDFNIGSFSTVFETHSLTSDNVVVWKKYRLRF